MADNQIDVKAAQQAISMLAKAFGMTGISGGRGTSSAADDYKQDTSSKMSNDDFGRLKNIVKNNGDAVQQINIMLKKVAKEGKNIEGLYDALDKSTRQLNDTQRRAALALADQIAASAKTSKNAAEKLQEIASMAKEVKASLKTNKDTLKSLDEANALQLKLVNTKTEKEKQYIEKLNGLEKQLSNATDDITKKKLKRQISSTKSAKTRVSRKSSANIASNSEEIRKLNNAYDSAVESIEKMNSVTASLSDAEIQILKKMRNMSATQREQHADVIQKVSDGAEGLEKSTGIAADNIAKNSGRLGKMMNFAATSVKVFGSALLKAIPALVNDMMARQRYNVEGTDYTGSMMRGMSEQERYQLIDQNRIPLRTMGNGNEEQGFKNTKALQTSSHMFGLYGAPGLQKALEYQKTVGQMGISYSNVGATQVQMSFMKNFAKQIGESNESLQNFYSALNDMGQVASMSAAANGKTDKERQDSVNKEIYQRLQLNKTIGVSIELVKQQQQEATNARYGGIENIIRGQIRGKMMINQYNAANPNNQLTDAEVAAFNKYNANGGNVSGVDQAAYNNVAEKIGISDQARYKKAQGNSSANLRLTLGNQMTDTIGGFGPNRQEFDIRYGNAAMQNKAQGTNAIDTSKTFGSTLDDAISKMNGPEGFTAAVFKATEVLHGFNSFGGGAFGGIGQSIMGGIGGFIGSSILKHIATKVLSGGGVESGATLLDSAKTGISSVAKFARGGISKAGSFIGKGAKLESLTDLGSLASKGSKFLGDAVKPITAMISAWNAGSDVLEDGGKRFSQFKDSLGIDPSKPSGWKDTAAQTANVFNKLGNGLTFGAAGKFSDNPKSWLQSGDMALSAFNAGHPLDAFNIAKTGVFDFGGNNTSSPTQMVNEQLKQQAELAANSGDTDAAIKILKEIAKSNKEMNDRDNKNDQQNQAEKEKTVGSAYGEYQTQLQQVISSVSSKS